MKYITVYMRLRTQGIRSGRKRKRTVSSGRKPEHAEATEIFINGVDSRTYARATLARFFGQ